MPLSDVKGISLEIFAETSPREPTLEYPPIEFKTSYQVKIKSNLEIDRTIEYNSISAFSNLNVHNEFRNLIIQTEDVLKETLIFLNLPQSLPNIPSN